MAVRTDAPAREHRVQTDVGTHIPIDRTGMQESTQRVQNFRLMRASPEELLVASVDDQLEPLGRTRQDSHRDRVGRKQAIGEWAEQSTHRLGAFERGSHKGRDSHDPTLAQTMKLVFQPGASSISLPKIGYRPSSDIDYCPLNPYGESKVLGERLVKQQAANAEFIVVRS